MRRTGPNVSSLSTDFILYESRLDQFLFKVLFIKNFPLLAYSSVTITTASYFSSRSQSTWTKHIVALNKSLAITHNLIAKDLPVRRSNPAEIYDDILTILVKKARMMLESLSPSFD